MIRGLLPGGLEEPRPVAVEDALDILGAVAAGLQDGLEFAEVGYGVEVGRRLFPAETSVEIAADGDMARVARELADVVHVTDDIFERYVSAGRPIGNEHPVVERRADYASALDDQPDLVVIELTAAWGDGAAIVVAGEDRSFEEAGGFVKAFVGEVGEI